MFKLLEHADCFIIFNGGTGTLSEFGTAFVLARLYYPHHKPFILYGSFWKPIVKVLTDNMKIRKEALKVFKIVESKKQVLEVIEEFEKEIAKADHSRCKICKEKAFMT